MSCAPASGAQTTGRPFYSIIPCRARIEPCLATLVPTAPAGDQWAFEIKRDSYHLAALSHAGEATIVTRGDRDLTDRFPSIADAAKRLPVDAAILDGEAFVLDDRGASGAVDVDGP